MSFGGSGWKPASRRNRRQQRGSRRRSTREGSDRTFLILLAVFTVLVLGLVLFIGFQIT